ncbi:hypothetical protein [Nonomuraea sp. B1E8]|uniref:hypothetical protein n=1 Tax=unclassified Nonomuraea TaxID=2593643 RepID=UPI00325E69D8
MDGLRAGRVWVDHGGLISGLVVRVVRARTAGHGQRGVTLGETLDVRRGDRVELTIDPAHHAGGRRAARPGRGARPHPLLRRPHVGAPPDRPFAAARDLSGGARRRW